MTDLRFYAGPPPSVQFDALFAGAAYATAHMAVTHGDWAQLDRAASALTSAGHATLDAACLSAGFARLGGLGQDRVLSAALAQALVSAALTDAQIEGMAAALAARDRLDIDAARARVAEMLEAIPHLAEAPLDEMLPNPLPDISGPLATWARGMLARLHAQFNATLDQAGSGLSMIDDPASVIASEVAALTGRHRDRLARLQTAVADRDPVAAREAARDLGRFTDHAVVLLGRLMSRGRALSRAQLAAGQNTLAEATGDVEVEGARLARRMIATGIGAYRVALSLERPQDTPDLDELRAAASTLDLAATLRNGADRALHRLDAGDDGTLVDLRGIVVEVEAITTYDDELIGRTLLRDPSSGAELDLIGMFINPGRIGIAPGGFVHATGTYWRSADMNAGAPALQIERFSDAEYQTGGWETVLAASAAPWFSMWRNRHALSWSISPHVAQPPVLDVDIGGAGELLFLNFDPTEVEDP